MTIAVTAPPPLALSKAPLTRGEAEALTYEIRNNANRLWMLVSVAHDRKAWRALGYESWKDYVAAELRITEARSFQLVDTGRVMLAIAEAAGVDPGSIDPVTARNVAKVKHNIPRLQRAIRTAMSDAAERREFVELNDVIHDAVRDLREQLVDTKTVTVTHTTAAIACPVCDGHGYLGTGRKARDLADRAARWIARYR